MSITNVNPKDLKFIIYARKSTEGEDRQMASLPDQLDIAKQIVAKNKYKVVKIFQEAASASKCNNRPKFDQMVRMIEQGKANGIICWQTNRLARNPKENGIIQQLLIEGRLKLIHTNDRVYRPEDNAIVFGVEASMAAQYSIDLSKNVTRGVRSKNKHGHCTYVAPQGYLNKRDRDTNQPIIEIDPDRFYVLQRMFKLYLTGNYSVPDLLSILNDDYHFTTLKHKKRGGKPLTLAGLYGILENPFYMGKIRDIEDKNIFHQGAWQPMITEDEYWRVQRLRSKYAEDHNLRPTTLVKSARYELKGLLSCAHCGCSIIGEHHDRLVSDGTYNEHMYYKCTRKSPYRKCCMRGTISEKEAFRQIDALLDHYTLHPLLYQWAMEVLDSVREKELLERYDIAKIKNASMDDCEKEFHELVKMRRRNLINDEQFEREAKLLQNLMDDIKRSAEDNEERQRKWYEIIGKTLNTLTSPKEKFHLEGDIGERRAILLSIGPKATLRQINYINELEENAIVVPQKSAKAITAKIIEVKPYKWIEVIDKGKRQIEEEFFKNDKSGCITEKSPFLQGSSTLKSHLFQLWSGRQDSNLRPLLPKSSALPTVPRPDDIIIPH